MYRKGTDTRELDRFMDMITVHIEQLEKRLESVEKTCMMLLEKSITSGSDKQLDMVHDTVEQQKLDQDTEDCNCNTDGTLPRGVSYRKQATALRKAAI